MGFRRSDVAGAGEGEVDRLAVRAQPNITQIFAGVRVEHVRDVLGIRAEGINELSVHPPIAFVDALLIYQHDAADGRGGRHAKTFRHVLKGVCSLGVGRHEGRGVLGYRRFELGYPEVQDDEDRQPGADDQPRTPPREPADRAKRRVITVRHISHLRCDTPWGRPIGIRGQHIDRLIYCQAWCRARCADA
ncbi:Uncharacterised protein [Mycobacteroides abscessus subsp. abscessus]|nr:Uncharacterised protein [Mycobacteroides abscessus subsp. abscessus]